MNVVVGVMEVVVKELFQDQDPQEMWQVGIGGFWYWLLVGLIFQFLRMCNKEVLR